MTLCDCWRLRPGNIRETPSRNSLTRKPPNRHNGLRIRWSRRAIHPEMGRDVADAEANEPAELVTRHDASPRGVLKPSGGHSEVRGRLLGIEERLSCTTSS